MKNVGVAILGLGVVGSGTYKILRDHREFYRQTQGVDITVESVQGQGTNFTFSLDMAAAAGTKK